MRYKPVHERGADQHEEEEARRLIIEIEREEDHEHHHLRPVIADEGVERYEEKEQEPEKS